jgi:Domain of unknown function (DUF4258)
MWRGAPEVSGGHHLGGRKAALKRIVYTAHASQELARRQISDAWVERVVRGPAWVEGDPNDAGVQRRFGVVAEFGGRVLRVAVRESASEVLIVTAVFDRGAGKRLERGERP